MRMPVRIWFEYEAELERLKAESLTSDITASAFPWQRDSDRGKTRRSIQTAINSRTPYSAPKTFESYKRRLRANGIGVHIVKKS